MTRFLLICLGGAIGTAARYLTSLWAARELGSAFPFGTVIVNVLGSFLIAFLMQLEWTSVDVRMMLTTGVMGGFTTYSAFNFETTTFLRNGAWRMAALNVTVTLVACLAAGVAGLALGRVVTSR